ncbi:methyl-accepting chemotaxis protein [Konateibacter massiliensis]|uniref:methyl-accepting chemotaxis protein n=1 Tax=Konateibacter massiliensis TaxID=2002841 RepID=UPI000C15CE70|nr:methyl-accepting chemotaxis protein [Konateibacter massiliensis]
MKERLIQKQEKTRERSEKAKGISIRIQLILGFLVPILFIIAVGVVSYSKSSEGMTMNYEASSMTALEMTVITIEEAMKSVVTTTSELSQDATVSAYSLGGFASDSAKQSQAKKAIRNNLNVKETSNDMISAIHIIPLSGNAVITTKTMSSSEIDSFMEGLLESEDSGLLTDAYVHWGSSHPYIDEEMEISQDDYILYCSRTISAGSNKALAVVDISRDAVLSLLKQLDFGENAQASFITADGHELKSGNDISISDTDFYQEFVSSSKSTMSEYVDYEGITYYFMSCKSDTTGGYVSVMVPKSVITKSSDSIGRITIVLVVTACIAAILIATLIVSNIGRNITRSVSKLDKVAEGELLEETVRHRSSKNEFGKLHKAISNTVARMRELVLTVKKMIGVVSNSGEKVSASSKQVSSMVVDMSVQIEDILNIIERENQEITNCDKQMEGLSGKIKRVSSAILTIVDEINHSKGTLTSGIGAVSDMARQSRETSEATDEVQKQVMELSVKLNDISVFVDSIREIAEETNLLSLNASIEAARAGENGKGFAVVAEEIRKLADNSANTAQSIQYLIEGIRTCSGNAIDKVHTAEAIVALQEKSVQNTSEVFSEIHTFMESLIQNMQQVTGEVEEMNQERKVALKSIRAIRELSEDTVQSANVTSTLLERQIVSAGSLEEEAKSLEENMRELEIAVASFKLTGEAKSRKDKKIREPKEIKNNRR